MFTIHQSIEFTCGRDVTTISSKTGSARVLTSNECWSLYKVKEEKKKCEAEEKEKRKQERERKKREKEIEQEFDELRRRKRNESRQRRRKKRSVSRQRRRKLRKVYNTKLWQARNALERSLLKLQQNQGHLNLVEGGSKITSRRTLHKRSKFTMDSSIFTNLCCVCFSSFEDDEGTGREWLQCIFSRCIHEDCVVPNPNGENKLCLNFDS